MTNRRNKRRRAMRNASLDFGEVVGRVLTKCYLKPLVSFMNGEFNRAEIRRLKRRNYLETGSATRWRRIPKHCTGIDLILSLSPDFEWPRTPVDGIEMTVPITWERNP